MSLGLSVFLLQAGELEAAKAATEKKAYGGNNAALIAIPVSHAQTQTATHK